MSKQTIQITPSISKICVAILMIYNCLIFIAVMTINCNMYYKLILLAFSAYSNYQIIKHLFVDINQKFDILAHNMQVITWEQHGVQLWNITRIECSGIILMILHLQNTMQCRKIPIFIDSIPYKQYKMLRSKMLWHK